MAPEQLLSVGIDIGTSAPQAGVPAWGPRNLTSSAGVNPACGKPARGADFTGLRPPRAAGPRWRRCRYA